MYGTNIKYLNEYYNNLPRANVNRTNAVQTANPFTNRGFFKTGAILTRVI